jgi:hypothetical protein
MSTYLCPMDKDVRLVDPGKCPKCGMALVAQDARFRLLQHMAGNPVMLAVMVAVMFAAMAAAMMLIH